MPCLPGYRAPKLILLQTWGHSKWSDYSQEGTKAPCLHSICRNLVLIDRRNRKSQSLYHSIWRLPIFYHTCRLASRAAPSICHIRGRAQLRTFHSLPLTTRIICPLSQCQWRCMSLSKKSEVGNQKPWARNLSRRREAPPTWKSSLRFLAAFALPLSPRLASSCPMDHSQLRLLPCAFSARFDHA